MNPFQSKGAPPEAGELFFALHRTALKNSPSSRFSRLATPCRGQENTTPAPPTVQRHALFPHDFNTKGVFVTSSPPLFSAASPSSLEEERNHDLLHFCFPCSCVFLSACAGDLSPVPSAEGKTCRNISFVMALRSGWMWTRSLR